MSVELVGLSFPVARGGKAAAPFGSRIRMALSSGEAIDSRRRVTAMHHCCRVIASPWPGVFGTDVDSGRQYGKHWHSTFGMGFIERGAHRSMSGRGTVDAYAGEV